VNRRPSHELQQALSQLQSAQAELDELNKQLRSFEALVDARLGGLLDQLSELNTETSSLDAKLRHIREERLFGTDLMRYLEGAPQPARRPNLTDLPPLGLAHRGAIHGTIDKPPTSPEQNIPDIKVLYRKLARRYHPDLARSDVDRASSNEQMTEINRAYNSGDLQALMKLAGIGIPYGVNLRQPPLQPGKPHDEPQSELERAEWKLKAVRQQITRLSSLSIVKLSLEVKLARHQGRDLLSEMAADLQYKVARKLAERDYLRSQIQASGITE
jgi:hypothetical protein